MKKIKLNNRYKEIYRNAVYPFETANNQEHMSADKSDWLIFLDSSIQQYKRFPITSLINKESINDPLKLLVTPFVKAARINLLSDNALAYMELNNAVRESFETSLYIKLIKVCEYSISKLAGINSEVNSPESDKILLSFVSSVYKNPLVFFKEYSVLARLLSMTAINWLSSTHHILNRLVKDYADVHDMFHFDNKLESRKEILNSITEIQLDLSDPHEHGQSVAIITLKNNRVVYKPKSMQPELLFSEFIKWFNTKLSENDLTLNFLSVIDRVDYGWSEYTEHKSCSTQKQIESFYQRTGMFGAILYALRGTDYHHENVIANGEFPEFIDHEMLFYPVYVDADSEPGAQDVAALQNAYHESVINTRLFPISENRINGITADVSAVGYYNQNETNTNLPYINNKYFNYENYKEQILSGFKQAYEILTENKEFLLSDKSPLGKFKNQDFRYNMRATSSYLTINKSCLVPDALKSGVGFCNYIHSIRVTLPSVFSNGLPMDMRQEELEILTRLDVPRFTSNGTLKALSITSKPVFKDIFTFTGFDLVESRINGFGEDDLAQQLVFLDDALFEGQEEVVN